jgi:argininosuccinate lyase
MPQKKNPDVPELVRGKAGRAIGNLVALLTVVKGLPLAYNRDLQEDKEPVFDSAATLRDSFAVMAGAISTLRVDAARMRRAAEDPLLLATDLAEVLVREGVPFRDAHEAVGRAVRLAEDRGVPLDHLGAADWNAVHPGLGAAAGRLFATPDALDRRGAEGGTSPARVREAIERLGDDLTGSAAAPRGTAGDGG